MGFLLNLASFFLCFSYQISYSFPIPFLTSIDVAADENPIYCYRWRPCGRSMQIFFFFFVLFRFLSFFWGFYARRESILVWARKEITVPRISREDLTVEQHAEVVVRTDKEEKG